MIVQNVAHSGDSTDVTFTVPTADLARSIEVLNAARERIGFIDLKHDTRVSKISVVGVGLSSQDGVATPMIQTLGPRGLHLQAIATPEITANLLHHADHH